MKISLRIKFIISFTVIVVLTGLVIAWAGIHFIGKGIIREAQKRVEMDLHAARELYNKERHCVSHVIRLTTDRFFIKSDSLWNNIKDFTEELEAIRVKEMFDILTLTDSTGKVVIRSRNPEIIGDSQAHDDLVSRVLREGKTVESTQIISKDELQKEGRELVAQSLIKTVPTPKAKPSKKKFEDSGMMIKAASPVRDAEGNMLGVLYGGKLLNRNYTIVDKVLNTVFRDEIYKGKHIGTATIFQGDVRIATNVKNDEGNRAIGTRVSEEVSDQVLVKGKSWIDRAFVVNNWYISAYEPIRNIQDEVIGILYVGILEQKYTDLEKRTFLIFIGITLVGVAASLLIAYLLSNGIIRPVKELVSVSKQFAKGNLDARVKYNSNNELGELGGAFNMMISSVMDRDKELRKRAQEEIMKSERLAMIGQLAAGVAHEINNPLGSILLFNRLVLKKCPPEGIMRDNLERVEKEVKRCQNVVQGLLEFARQREPRIESINIHELLDKTINLFENQPMFHNIGISKNYYSNLPVISADPAQIQQVFVNIIMNAVDAMNGKGMLTFSTVWRENDDCIEINFTDTGCGIPSDTIDRIFEPFFTTKGVGHGTGLGLSISYGIIQRHGGNLKVTSRINDGSTFIIILPTAKMNS